MNFTNGVHQLQHERRLTSNDVDTSKVANGPDLDGLKMHQAQSERRQTEPLTPIKEKRSLPERGAANTGSLEKPATTVAADRVGK